MKKLWYALPAIPGFLLFTAWTVAMAVSLGLKWWDGVVVSLLAVAAVAVVVGLVAATFALIELAEKKANK